jgi:hypothetical protein
MSASATISLRQPFFKGTFALRSVSKCSSRFVLRFVRAAGYTLYNRLIEARRQSIERKEFVRRGPSFFTRPVMA